MSVLCKCKIEASRFQVKKEGKNKGKWFFTCRGRKCGFFKWDNTNGGSFPTNTYVPNKHDEKLKVDPPYCQNHQMSCVRRISNSERNPNRAYFSCPGDRECMFQWENEWIRDHPNGTRKISVDCQLSSAAHFVVYVPICPFTKQIQEVLMKMNARPRDGMFELPLNQMKVFMKNIQEHAILGEKTLVKGVPDKILNLVSCYGQVNYADMVRRIDLREIPYAIRKSAHQFQHEGIRFGISRNGKYLLADEMGLGKTLQAIAVSYYYRRDWPLLVICPSSLKMNWANEFQKWTKKKNGKVLFPGGFVNILWSGRDRLSGRVNVISYDLVVSMQEKIKKKNFQSIIVDETHYIKNSKAQRTKVIVPIIQNARRAIMITGTPALSRPVELYSQLSALFSPSPISKKKKKKRKDPWISWQQYVFRYCNAFDTGNWIDDKGASNLLELNVLLASSIMIRRLKKDVLKQLPPKLRSALWVNIPKTAMKDIKQNQRKVNIFKSKQRMQVDAATSFGVPEFSKDEMIDASTKKGSAFMRMYRVTGVSKLPVLKQIIQHKLKAESERFLIYGHHLKVLDGIEEIVKDEKVDYIRIDGSTPPEKRAERADRFTRDKNCRVAVLSLTACGTGLTLTPCANVMFAELTWTPGALKQAEDRVHRIGQKNCVSIQYILAKGTVDEQLWGMIQNKLDVVGDALGDQGGEGGTKREAWETKLRPSQTTPTFLLSSSKGNLKEEEEEGEEDDEWNDAGEIENRDFEVEEEVYSKAKGKAAELDYQKREILRKRSLIRQQFLLESPPKNQSSKQQQKRKRKLFLTPDDKKWEEKIGESSEEDLGSIAVRRGRGIPKLYGALPSNNMAGQTGFIEKEYVFKQKKKRNKRKSRNNNKNKNKESSSSSSSTEESDITVSSSSSSSSDESSEDEEIKIKRKKKKKKNDRYIHPPPRPSINTNTTTTRRLTYQNNEGNNNKKKKKKKSPEHNVTNVNITGKKRKRRSHHQEPSATTTTTTTTKKKKTSPFSPKKKKAKLTHYFGTGENHHQQQQHNNNTPNSTTTTPYLSKKDNNNNNRRKSSLERSLERSRQKKRKDEEKKRLLEDISKDNIFAKFVFTPPPNREKRKSASFF